jgi:hypothetical protein
VRLSHGAPGDTPAIFDVAQSWEDAATGDAQDDGQLGAMGKRGKMGGLGGLGLGHPCIMLCICICICIMYNVSCTMYNV